MNVKYFRIYAFIGLLIGILASCSKMDATYRDFTSGGDIVYPAKVDGVKTYSGNNRIDLSMLLTTDPKITKVKVYWNNGLDSAEKGVQRSAGVDTVRFSLTNMTEGTYTFSIYTYDKAGNRSVKTDVIGNVFGSRYSGALYNRSVKSMAYTGNSNARLVWYGPANQMIGQHIRYTDSLGVLRNVMEPIYKADVVTLKDTTFFSTFKKGTTVEFRTMFKPETFSIDTFYSGFESRVIQ